LEFADEFPTNSKDVSKIKEGNKNRNTIMNTVINLNFDENDFPISFLPILNKYLEKTIFKVYMVITLKTPEHWGINLKNLIQSSSHPTMGALN
jgi:hypothetical protein